MLYTNGTQSHCNICCNVSASFLQKGQFKSNSYFILKLSFTSYILNLALKTNLASKGGNGVKYSDSKYFSKQRFLVFLFFSHWLLRVEMHNSSPHISYYVSINLCQLSPHTNHQCSDHTVCRNPSPHLPSYFHMGTLTFRCKPFLQDHHDFSAK